MRLNVLVSGTASDSHTWNLVYLQLFLEAMGNRVVNLGPCVPPQLLAARCLAHKPELIVLSSVNGHGYQDGLRAITRLREEPELAGVPAVIGGMLGVAGERDAAAAARLREAGFDAVFDDGDLEAFERFVARLAGTPATAGQGRAES